TDDLLPGLLLGQRVGNRGTAGGRAARARVGGVPVEFRRDLRVPGGAAAHQPVQQPPAQFGVYHQAVDGGGAVQQPGEQRQVGGGDGHGGERVCVRELDVRPGLGPLQQSAQRRGG